jgi:hypothetical protein
MTQKTYFVNVLVVLQFIIFQQVLYTVIEFS